MVINKGPAHPLAHLLETKIREMRDKGVDIRSLALACRQNRMGGAARPGLPDGKHLVSCLTPEQREAGLAWIRALRFGKKDLEAGTDGGFNRVNPLEVYGRVDKEAPLCDIGSGNGFRMQVCGHDVIGHEIDMGRVPEENRAIVCPTEDFGGNAVGRVVTSFNALTDIRMDIGAVVGKQGIHVFPDLPYLQRVGLARKAGDYYVCKDHTGAERWKDRDPGFGSPFTDGYRCAIWLDPIAITLDITGSCYTTPIRSHGKRVTDSCDLALGSEEVSYKYDGEHYKLVISGGQGRFTAEGGRCLLLNAVGDAPDVDVDLEKMGDGRFIVTRVSRVAPFWPHHTLDTIEKFCGAVTVVLGGTHLNIVPPERFDHDRCLALLSSHTIDGLVLKREDTDHLVKSEQTVDIPDTTPLDAYVEAAAQAGYHLAFPDDHGYRSPDTNCTEFLLRRRGPDIDAVFKKRRAKAKWDRPLDLVKCLEWPTLYTYVTRRAHADGQ